MLWSGRLFHAVGPEAENEQPPNLVEDHGIYGRLFNENLSLLSAAKTLKYSRTSSLYLVGSLECQAY